MLQVEEVEADALAEVVLHLVDGLRPRRAQQVEPALLQALQGLVLVQREGAQQRRLLRRRLLQHQREVEARAALVRLRLQNGHDQVDPVAATTDTETDTETDTGEVRRVRQASNVHGTYPY